MISAGRNALRSALCFYIAHCPWERGKGRLLHTLKPWLRAPGDVGTVTTSFGCTMELDLMDYVQSWIYFFGAYERPLVEWFRARLTQGMVFADVGAQVGQFTLLSAKIVGAEGHVHAFEPSPASLARLRKNVALNSFRNVTFHEMAIADFHGQADLFLQEQNPSGLNTGTNSLRMKADWKKSVPVKVEVRPLDEVFKDSRRLDALKVDVEGAELAVIRGARETLMRFKPLIAIEAEEISAQAFGYSTRELKETLIDSGYQLFRISREGRSLTLTAASSAEPEESSMLVGVPSTV
jgi:FkbM family methyltransferase